MHKHHDIKVLPYPQEKLFSLVADVEKYHEFLPWCSAARILKREGNETLAELAISYKGFSESYVSKVILDPPAAGKEVAKIDVNLEKGPFKSLTNHWNFKKIDENNTEVEFFVEFEFKSIILDKMVGGILDKANQKIMAAFEEQAAKVLV